MILSSAQSKQYYRVFNSFLKFLVDWFKEQDLLDDIIDHRHVYREYEVENALLDAVFGEDGHREVVDAFVDAKRGLLSREDLDVALDYKHVIAGEYYAVRKGADVYFLEGAYAYVVRGITHELDDRFLDLPMHVFTYLVPFHSYITYLTVMRPLSMRLPNSEERSLLDRISEAERLGCLIRTGDELKAKDQAKVIDRYMPLSTDVFDGVDFQERVGVLAGLNWDERQVQIARHKEQAKNCEELLDKIAWQCAAGEPVHEYRDIISRHDVDMLRQFVEGHNVYDELTKEGYVDLLVDIYKPRLPKVTDDLRILGPRYMREIRDLCAQVGDVHLSKDAVRHGEDVPRPIFPHVAVFDMDTEYAVVLSDEMRAVCEDVDWEVEIARAERLEEALTFLDVATDYRGIIARNEALLELERRFDNVDSAELEEAIRRRSVNGFLHTFPVTLDDREYFVAANLLDDEGKVRADKARGIIAKVRRIRAVWPTPEQVTQGRLVDAWASYEEGRRLAAYLDAHVIDTADDYDYASDTIKRLIRIMQLQQGAFSYLATALLLLAHDDAQYDEVSPLLQDFYNALPNRYCNGSVPRQRWDQDLTPRKTKKKRPTKKRRR